MVSLFDFVAGAAVFLGAVTSWPQAWRAWRRGVNGISITAVAFGISTMSAWAAYTARSSDWPALAATACVAAGWLVTLGALGARAVVPGSTMVVVVLVAVLVGSILWSTPVMITGYAAMGGSLVWVVPQAWRARRGDLDGVSAHAWGLLVAECATWVLYGLLAGHWVYIPGSAWQILIAGYVTVRTVREHRRRTRPGSQPVHDVAAAPRTDPT